MRIKNIALIQAVVLAAIMPLSSNVQLVKAEDYCIELIMEVNELPINYIESNRVAYIPIKVKNNPGINSLSFIIARDERIKEAPTAIRDSDFPFGMELQSVSNENNIYTGVDGGYGFGDYYYDTDGVFCALKIVLPENYSVGDFYSFNFCSDEVDCICPVRFEKDGQEYGNEHYSYVNGGIKIVDAVSYGYTPEETSSPVAEVPQNNNDQPPVNENQTQNQNDNNSNDNSNNNNSISKSENSKTNVTVTTSVKSSTSTGTTAAVTTTGTTVSKSVSKTETADVTTTKKTVTKPITETEQTEALATGAHTNKNGNSTKIIAAVVSALILLAIGAAAVIIRKKKK